MGRRVITSAATRHLRSDTGIVFVFLLAPFWGFFTLVFLLGIFKYLKAAMAVCPMHDKKSINFFLDFSMLQR